MFTPIPNGCPACDRGALALVGAYRIERPGIVIAGVVHGARLNSGGSPIILLCPNPDCRFLRNLVPQRWSN